MRELATAVAFLTRLPVPVQWTGGAETVGRSARFFPLAGLLLGGIYALLLLTPAPPAIVAVSIVIAEALLTGALHMDGLADMADGFGGGHTREDVLRIMRDHQIGTYGAVALLLTLGLKAAALEQLAAGRTWLPVLLAPALARWCTTWLSFMGPYARTGGTGAVSRFVGRTEVAVASTTALVALTAARSLPLAAAATLMPLSAIFFLRWSRRRIGGVTGDVIGACTEVSETLFLTAAVWR